jgi:hypothetical protein
VLTFKKAEELAKIWLKLTTDDSFKISKIYDKPYGWVFAFQYKNYDPADPYTRMIGGCPYFLVDRTNGEIHCIEGGPEGEPYLRDYEDSLPAVRLQMTPERHDGVKKYE